MSYIRLDRAIKNWRYKTKPDYVALWIDLLVNANWEEKQWLDEVIGKGELVTSLEHLSQQTGLGVQTVRTILKKLENNEISLKSTNKYTKITILKWEEYQCCEENQQTTNKQLTNNQQTTNKQLTTTKEYKEYKNNKNIYIGDEIVDKSIKEFIEMRNKIKKPMTNRAVELLVKKLKEISNDPNTQVEILNQSIVNCWQGIYPLKEKIEKPKYEENW